jgi:4,5-dihydroxyphthalate decarboxylase
VWARALLTSEFGVDLDQVRWLTYEEGHVAGVQEPPNVHRDPAHADLAGLLLEGALDAAIVDPVPDDPVIATVVADPAFTWRAWRQKTGAQTLNHVVVVRESLAEDAARMTELVRLFRESAGFADVPIAGSFFVGFDAIHRSLEIALEAAAAQHLLARPLTVADLILEYTP